MDSIVDLFSRRVGFVETPPEPLTLQPSLSLPRRAVRGYPKSPVTLRSLEPYETEILEMAKCLGAVNEKAGEFYETGAVIHGHWARFNGDGSRSVIHFDSLL
jgi:hypothetical protein